MSDHLFYSVLGSLLANALTGACRLAVSARWPFGRRDSDIEALLSDDRHIRTLLERAGSRFAKLRGSDVDSGAWRLFLASTNVECILREYFLIAMAMPSSDYRERLKELFVEYARSFAGITNLAVVEAVFDDLIEACETALQKAIEKGHLEAHELRSEHRSKILLQHLDAIRSKLDKLATDPRPSPEDIDAFMRRYVHQAAARYKWITPPHTDRQRRIPVTDIYVTPEIFSASIRMPDNSEDKHDSPEGCPTPLIESPADSIVREADRLDAASSGIPNSSVPGTAGLMDVSIGEADPVLISLEELVQEDDDDSGLLDLDLEDSSIFLTMIPVDNLQQSIHRSVLLGHPGAGKSTYATTLSYEVATNYSQGSVGRRLVAPMVIALREYGAWRRNNQASLLRFIHERCM